MSDQTKQKSVVGWKVCRKNVVNGKPSYFSSFAKGKYRIEYKKGRNRAVPQTLGIFIFSHKSDAHTYIGDQGVHIPRLCVIRCLYDPDEAKLLEQIPSYNPSALDYFYAHKKVELFTSPSGTLCVPEITIPEL